MKDMTLKDEPYRLESVQYASGEDQGVITNNSRKMKQVGQSRNYPQRLTK